VPTQLSQNVAGVTLLALGNGAPDLFSSFSATEADSPDLAVGGVVGAGIFITTVCVGGVAFLAPFKVTRRPFLRDVVFYIVALVRMHTPTERERGRGREVLMQVHTLRAPSYRPHTKRGRHLACMHTVVGPSLVARSPALTLWLCM
jgi:hypothetical protein